MDYNKTEIFCSGSLKARVRTFDNPNFFEAYRRVGPLALTIYDGEERVFSSTFKTRDELFRTMNEFSPEWRSRKEVLQERKILELEADQATLAHEVKLSARAEASYEQDASAVRNLFFAIGAILCILIASL